ncbi:MAG: hypothetical protein WCW03_02385 [Candidatus Paceibacterota bacterium]|jgi:competence protein ComEC
MLKRIIIFIVIFGLLSGAVFYIYHLENRAQLLEIFVFNIKSGNSIFIRTPNDKRILVNGGSNSQVLREITKILPFYSRRIDMVIATNTEGKNVAGLIDILGRYKVDRVILSAITLQSIGLSTSTDLIYETFLDSINIPKREVSAGESIVLDKSNGNDDFGENDIVADILFPVSADTFSYSKTSDPEIVLNINFGSTNILLVGNTTPKIQKFITSTAELDRIMNNTNVLVISNNASKTNLAKQMVDEFKPKYVIYSKLLSSGKTANGSIENTKDDPLLGIPEANRYNIKEKGSIRIISDGSIVRVEESR